MLLYDFAPPLLLLISLLPKAPVGKITTFAPVSYLLEVQSNCYHRIQNPIPVEVFNFWLADSFIPPVTLRTYGIYPTNDR